MAKRPLTKPILAADEVRAICTNNADGATIGIHQHTCTVLSVDALLNLASTDSKPSEECHYQHYDRLRSGLTLIKFECRPSLPYEKPVLARCFVVARLATLYIAILPPSEHGYHNFACGMELGRSSPNYPKITRPK